MAGDRPAVDTLWQVTVEGPEAVAAAAADALAAASDPAALSTQLFEQPDMTWRASALYAAEPDADALADILLDHVSGDAVSIEVLPPRDWVADSVKSLDPVLAGRFAVAIPERARDVPNGATPIVVEAAQAFGTGHHGTTLGCLLMLQTLARFARPRSVLDVGTGTGLLAIAAVKLWRCRALATDIDPLAVAATRRNAHLNAVAPWIASAVGAGLAHPRLNGQRFDLITANILAWPLIAMAGDVAAHLEPGGHVVLSGLLDAQTRTVAAAYRRRGLILRRRMTIDGWSTLWLSGPPRR